ncbi:hypothetical protein ON010_g13449 [Phytophthora cinnamomi]|nr:hypothetical protein ON010_g13449 [Phytophthora cinnamomi]
MEYNTYIRAVAAQFGSRLIVTQDQVRQMQRGVVPFEVYTMVNDGLELRPGHDLSRYNLPRNEDTQDEQFHLLVLLMLEEPRVQPTWKPEEPFIPALLDARLAFVGREAAVETLQDVHFGNATRRKQKVPLADSPRGFGKTEFAHHYVDQCKKTLKSGHFVVNRALAKAITEKLEPGTAPLMTFTDSAKDFLVGIVNDLGPLFIVVDDMDRGVLDTMGDSADSQQLFLQLYNCVLTQWIATPKVYFFVVGPGSVLAHDWMDAT